VAADEVPLSRLRSLWLALPFVPWLAWLVPWFAPFLSWPWLFLAFYFWPAIALASALGLPLASQYAIAIYSLPYCLAIAGILDLAVRVVARRRGAWRPIRARTARWVTAAFAVAVVALFAARYAQWIDWPPRATAIDDLPFPLRAYAAQITNSAVYEIPTGPVDSE
jgi:hypothetical protein